MKKKKEIIILGSTGSIGKSLINILKKYKSEIKINLLSTNTNLKEISKQSKVI
jgi:1-deoxy-D-xylulose-5-phosphate reductoisomerase